MYFLRKGRKNLEREKKKGKEFGRRKEKNLETEKKKMLNLAASHPSLKGQQVAPGAPDRCAHWEHMNST